MGKDKTRIYYRCAVCKTITHLKQGCHSCDGAGDTVYNPVFGRRLGTKEDEIVSNPAYPDGLPEDIKLELEHEIQQRQSIPIGWICPKCGCCMSPYAITCSCSTKITWTSNTSAAGPFDFVNTITSCKDGKEKTSDS